MLRNSEATGRGFFFGEKQNQSLGLTRVAGVDTPVKDASGFVVSVQENDVKTGQ